MPRWVLWALALFITPFGGLILYSGWHATSYKASAPVAPTISTVAPSPSPEAEIIQSTAPPPPALMQEVPNQAIVIPTSAPRARDNFVPSDAQSSQGDATLQNLADNQQSFSPLPQQAPQQAPQVQSPQASQGAQVWVNTKSGVYHFPGSRWYGNTSEGTYMSESAAIAGGNHAAQNGQ